MISAADYDYHNRIKMINDLVNVGQDCDDSLFFCLIFQIFIRTNVFIVVPLHSASFLNMTSKCGKVLHISFACAYSRYPSIDI